MNHTNLNTMFRSYIFILSITFFIACSDKKQQTESHEGHQHEMPQKVEKIKIELEVPTFDSTKIDKAQIDVIVNAYLPLKDAFVASNATETQKLAGELAAVISNEALQSLKTDAAKIKQTTDIEVQRLHFYQLSAKLFMLVKNYGGNKQALHQQYCPMAFDDQGAFWLSNKLEIRNPYFGDKMLTCGMVNETLAVK
jgi:hypothetical protein